MENRSYALATGLFVLLMSATLLAVAMWFRGGHVSFAHYTVVARQGVPGLNFKAPVKYQGVEIGKVEDIEFDPQDSRQVLVDISVIEDAPLNSSTFAQLGYQGITGLTFIDLSDDRSRARGKLDDGARIELRPSLIDRLGDAGPQLLARAADAAERLDRLLGDANQQRVAQALTHLDEAAQQVAELAHALQPVAGELAPLASDSRKLVAHADASLGHVDTLAEQSGQLVTTLQAKASALDQLATASAQLQRTVARLDAALVGPEHRADKPLIDELAQAAAAVRRSADQLSAEPQSLLLGHPATPPGPGEPGFKPPAKP
ncbi:MAG: MCE family protein [Paucibacter sp.]|nr:MCE family protein [Roseateles sp.]